MQFGLKIPLISASVLAVAAFVSGCQTTAGNACDGWRPVPLAPASAVYLVKNDRPAAEAVVGHNAFGRKKCGWK